MDGIGEAELASLLKCCEEATGAFMRGEMERYLELMPSAPGFTFVHPFGGMPVRNEDRATTVRAAAEYFQGGEASIEVVSVHSSGDLLVLVMIERQRGEVCGLPEQDWSLRVTQVYRRDGGTWRVVHRHADPMVREVGLEMAAAIARG